jgi:drug/metabolite transporter (DMT)-like permease
MAAGLLLTASNILLLESLTHIETSLGSTIYRLNTLGVVVLSLLFLHESLGLVKGLGVTAGLIAVFLLYQRRSGSSADNKRFLLYFALAVMAAIIRAGYGVTSKAGLIEGADLQLMLILGALNWVLGGAGYALLREKRFRITRKKALYAVVSGGLVFLIVNALMLAIERGQASVVIPVANMSFVMALALSVLFGTEKMTFRKLMAVLAAFSSILLLSQV